MEHGVQNGRPTKKVRRELELYVYEPTKSDLESANRKLTFESTTVYKVFALQFGGFLAFDIDQVHYCALLDKITTTRRLRTPLPVTAIC